MPDVRTTSHRHTTTEAIAIRLAALGLPLPPGAEADGALQLAAPTGNRLAIGAKVTVTAAGRRFVREVRSGSSFMSQGDLRLHVGLGAHAAPVDVEVRMPGGDRWAWRGLAVDRLHALELSPGTRIAPATGVSR